MSSTLPTDTSALLTCLVCSLLRPVYAEWSALGRLQLHTRKQAAPSARIGNFPSEKAQLVVSVNEAANNIAGGTIPLSLYGSHPTTLRLRSKLNGPICTRTSFHTAPASDTGRPHCMEGLQQLAGGVTLTASPLAKIATFNCSKKAQKGPMYSAHDNAHVSPSVDTCVAQSRPQQ